ncbi:head GIN domain-containing protein [Flavobacterium sp. AG291]|uniref:Head GIN domain-containing protein n=2 Tax=Flavobacterium suzhouense TaxID=1529638 RepID=A0ABW5NXT8_9FLAO|nr:head GIN domain-containing protein [Flavobacterium sp. AG291]RDI13307.1 putative autotransporter adhesin-like protein [Flavobacterium sp. AG291]
MKKAALLVAGLFFALTLTAQENKITVVGNGKIVKQKRDISDFSKISVTGSFQVSLTSGDTGKISLEGDENILQIIDTQVNNGTLIIATHSNKTIKPSRNNKVTIKVPYKLLDNIALNGCGTITSKGTLKGHKLKVMLDGPGHIDITTDQNELIAWVLGSGDIKIDGTAKQFECKIVGAGTVNAYDLSARQVTAAISGSGDAKVNSSYALKGRIAGNGTIAFAGQPQETDLKYMGNGSFSWE